MYLDLIISKSISQNSVFNEVSILTQVVDELISTISTLAIGDAAVTESPDHRTGRSKASILQLEEHKLNIRFVTITRIRI